MVVIGRSIASSSVGIEVPVLSGGLFAVTKHWWHEGGEYDHGMGMSAA